MLPSLALLLDVDGTLLDLAPRPNLVAVPADLPALLAALHARLGGALALVSGRAIASLDALLAPFRSAAAGLHGVEIRAEAACAVVPQVTTRLPPALVEAVTSLVRAAAPAFVEDKNGCLAVHYASAQHAAAGLRTALQASIKMHAPGWNMITGHCVFEIKPTGVDKGTACRTLMAGSAFHGRVPVYLGDDVTDLDAFAAVSALGGRTISVGPRVAGQAALALPSAEAAREWIARLERALASGCEAPERLFEPG